MAKKPVKEEKADNPFKKDVGGVKKKASADRSGYPPKPEKVRGIAVEIKFIDGEKRGWKRHERERVEKFMNKLVSQL